jgi:hypothetical protein
MREKPLLLDVEQAIGEGTTTPVDRSSSQLGWS